MRTTTTTNTTAGSTRTATSRSAPPRSGRVFLHTATNRSHDSNGNVTDDGTYKFKYNYKNLICEVRLTSNNNLVAEYKYDANGRRVEKAVSGGITQRYVCSGVETIATYNSSNTWKQDFVFGHGIDEIMMLEQADVADYDSDQNTSETTRSFYHRNAFGSVTEITDMAQAEAVSYRYSPYGELTITVGSVVQASDPLGQHWAFCGMMNDEETHLYYVRDRHYSAGDGRYPQREGNGFYSGPNQYEYKETAQVWTGALSATVGSFPSIARVLPWWPPMPGFKCRGECVATTRASLTVRSAHGGCPHGRLASPGGWVRELVQLVDDAILRQYNALRAGPIGGNSSNANGTSTVTGCQPWCKCSMFYTTAVPISEAARRTRALRLPFTCTNLPPFAGGAWIRIDLTLVARAPCR